MPQYCKKYQYYVAAVIEKQEENWKKVWEQLQKDFWHEDQHQRIYSRENLKQLRNVSRNQPAEILNYCREFSSIAKVLTKKQILGEYEAAELFLQGLPKETRVSVIEELGIEARCAETMKLQRILECVEKKQQACEAVARLVGDQGSQSEKKKSQSLPRKDQTVSQPDNTKIIRDWKFDIDIQQSVFSTYYIIFASLFSIWDRRKPTIE